MKQIFLMLSCIFIFGVAVNAQTRVTVKFVRGASSATVRGSVSGYRYVDYLVGARGGQTMSVKLSSASSYPSFVIFDGSMQNVEGALEETDWTGELPSTGTYRVRVLLPRSAARLRMSANYSLRISIN